MSHCWKNVLIKPTSSLLDALEIINNEALRVVLVVDDNDHLLGVVTDGLQPVAEGRANVWEADEFVGHNALNLKHVVVVRQQLLCPFRRRGEGLVSKQ